MGTRLMQHAAGHVGENDAPAARDLDRAAPQDAGAAAEFEHARVFSNPNPIEHPAHLPVAIGAEALMQPDARRKIRAVFVLLAQQPRRIRNPGDCHSNHVAARPPRRSTIASPCSPREAKVLLSAVAPFAPVVKRTSRRSPEPQVRVRFPAGAFRLVYAKNVETLTTTVASDRCRC